MDYKVSKNFDMDIPFEKLIEYTKTCKIDLESTHHFETYNNVMLFVSHPHKDEKFTIQIGVTEDGFMYEGDYGCQDDFKEIPIEEGLKILDHYRKLIWERTELVNLFLNNKLDKDVIEIKMR